MRSKINLISIFCAPKSGSTLLEILLGSHKLITSIGERRFELKKCNCEKSLYDCNFWKKISSKLPNKNALEILVDNKDDIKSNIEVFEVMLNYSNTNFILESSKSSKFIDKCIKNDQSFNLNIVTLVRDPIDLVQIQKKKELLTIIKKAQQLSKLHFLFFFIT